MKTILILALILSLIAQPILAQKATGSFVVTEQASQNAQAQEQNQSQLTGKAISEQSNPDKEDSFIIKFFKKLFSFFKL